MIQVPVGKHVGRFPDQTDIFIEVDTPYNPSDPLMFLGKDEKDHITQFHKF